MRLWSALSLAPLVLILPTSAVGPQRQAAPPTPDSARCRLFAVESHVAYWLVEDTEFLKRARRYYCRKVAEGKRSPDEAAERLDAIAFRLGYCRGPEVNPRLRNGLVDGKAPESLGKPFLRVHEKFCRDTHDPFSTGVHQMKTAVLLERAEWMRKELICQLALFVAYPDSWVMVLAPEEKVDSVKRLENLADSLCDELRSGDLSASDAAYRLQQEIERFKRHFPKEAAGQAGRQMLEPAEKLLGTLFKKLTEW